MNYLIKPFSPIIDIEGRWTEIVAGLITSGAEHPIRIEGREGEYLVLSYVLNSDGSEATI